MARLDDEMRLLEITKLEEKLLCEQSLAQFVKSAWHIIEPSTKLEWNWHLDTICGYLSAFDAGKLPDRRLIICIPPGTLKSILVSVMYPAWSWIKHPNERYLSITNEQGLAIRDALRMKDIVTSEWYQSKWGLGLKSAQNEKTLFVNEKQGFRQSQGISASNTGKRGSCVTGDTLVATESGYVRIDVSIYFNYLTLSNQAFFGYQLGNLGFGYYCISLGSYLCR